MHRCECPHCRTCKAHPERDYHHQINVLLSRLNEPQRRWVVALEAMRIAHGGKKLLAPITGLSPTTIARGCNELKSDLADCPDLHLHAAGSGRPAAQVQVQDPALATVLEQLLEPETAGDPMGRRQKAKCSSLRHLSTAMTAAAKLLHKLDCSPNCLFDY
jgi:hypothetical protein